MGVRENILDRIYVGLQAVPGVKSTYRNAVDVPEKARPAIVLFSADQAPDADDDAGERRPPGAPRRVAATPGIVVLLARTQSTIAPGTTLNAIRASILSVLLNDGTLAGLTLNGCGVRYLGSQTAYARGRSLSGEMQVSLQFDYLQTGY